MSHSVNLADISSEIGDNSICDMYVDTDQSDTSVMTPKVKSKRRYLMSPVLWKGYHGRKRARRGYSHIVSSTLKYTSGSSLGASARNIPFCTLLMSAKQPSNKNKVQQHLNAFMLCDTGASISLAPNSVAKNLGVKIDRTELSLLEGLMGRK